MDATELEMQDAVAEAALIGAVAHHPDACATVLADLAGSDFYDLVRGHVWDTCRKLSAEREPITPVTVARRMVVDKAWGTRAQTIVQTEMSTSVPASHAPRYANTVADLAARRGLLQAVSRSRQIIANNPAEPSELLSLVRAQFETTMTAPETGGPMSWDALWDEFEQVHAPGGSRPGIPSPWWELDDCIGGLFGGRVYVFGGRPGAGKSTAAINVAMHAAAESGKQALVISKEMSTVDVFGRIVAAGARVPLQEINARRIGDVEMARIRDYVKQVGNPPITVDAKPRTLSGVKTLARSHHHRVGLDVLVVDYLQLVRTDLPGRSREQEVGQVSRELKELAMELDCVVALPAQLNRDASRRANPRPTMSDLRDSGQIEQDADAVILLHREVLDTGEPTGQILLIVDKNRHGPTTEISLRWQGGYGAIG